MRRWRNPSLDVAQRQENTASGAACDARISSVFECVPNIVVVITCSHTSFNRPARDAVVAGALKAQAILHRRFACIQTVIDTQPAACDDILSLHPSIFDLPPRNLIPPHSKVLLISSCDDTSFTLRPPVALPPCCMMCINTILDSIPDLRLCKAHIQGIVSTAYEQSSSLSDSLVLKASLAKNVIRVETLLEEALDAAFVLAFLAFGCKVNSAARFKEHKPHPMFQALTPDASDAVNELQRICFENTAARRDSELFKHLNPQLVSLELNSHRQSLSSEDDFSVAAVAAVIAKQDRASMRRVLAGAVSSPAAAAAAKRNAQMRREAGTFITHSDIPAQTALKSQPENSPESDSAYSHLQQHVTNHILSFCFSFSASPPSSSPLLAAAIAREHLVNSSPILPVVSRRLLSGLLKLAVDRCGVKITEQCGVGSESFELLGDGRECPNGETVDMEFPVKLLICCSNRDTMKSMTGAVGCFLDDWLLSSSRNKRQHVSVYVDAAAMGNDVDCMDVLECIVVQVGSPAAPVNSCYCVKCVVLCLTPKFKLHAAIKQLWVADTGLAVDWRNIAAFDVTSAHALSASLVFCCDVLVQSLGVSRIIITLNAVDRVRPNNDMWLPRHLPRACSIVASCSEEWGTFACCMLCSGMPNSALFVVGQPACATDSSTLAALSVSVSIVLMLQFLIVVQVVDGRITAAAPASNRFDVRNMNQRVNVNVEDSVTFRDACGLKFSLEDDANISLDDVRLAAGVDDAESVQYRILVVKCAGVAALGLAGTNVEQLQMWLLQHVCRPHTLPWHNAARVMMYLCVSDDGLPLPLLVDIALFDYSIDCHARNVAISPLFVSICRTLLPCFVYSCVRARIACVSQRSGSWDGVMWKILTPDLLMPSLETVAGLSVNQAKINLLEYFEGGLKRYMSRINHEFHDQSPASNCVLNESHPSAASEADASAASTARPCTESRVPPPPALNLRRMIQGTQLALALGICFYVVSRAFHIYLTRFF
jgi:hypothetical protein